jgi:HNH endonuclease
MPRGSGLKKGDDNPYTDAELAVIRDTSLSLRQVSDQLGRSYAGVKKKASVLGVKRHFSWAGWEISLLEDTSLTLVEVARLTGRKLGTVEARASLQGIARGPLSGPRHHRWCSGNYAPTYRGSDWLEVRGQALERDGYTCQDCGFTDFSAQRLHVHHIIPFRFRPVNELRWLVTLCEPCHFKRPEHAWEELPAAVAAQLAADSGGGEQTGEALPPVSGRR